MCATENHKEFDVFGFSSESLAQRLRDVDMKLCAAQRPYEWIQKVFFKKTHRPTLWYSVWKESDINLFYMPLKLLLEKSINTHSVNFQNNDPVIFWYQIVSSYNLPTFYIIAENPQLKITEPGEPSHFTVYSGDLDIMFTHNYY